MSGGSWGYVCFRIRDVADRLREQPDRNRRAMAPHVDRLAAALRAIEWVDSGDRLTDAKEISAFLGGFGSTDSRIASVTLDELKTAVSAVDEIIKRMEAGMDKQLIPDKPGEWLYVIEGRIGLVALRTSVFVDTRPDGYTALTADRISVPGGMRSMTIEESIATGIRWAGHVPNDAELASRRLNLAVR